MASRTRGEPVHVTPKGAGAGRSAPPRVTGHATTGSVSLDAALGGGLPLGTCLLIEGEHGAGADVFALSVLHRAAQRAHEAPDADAHPEAHLLTAMRSPARAEREWHALFDDAPLDVRDVRTPALLRETLRNFHLREGDVVLLETAASLARAGHDVLEVVDELAELAADAGALVLVLSATGTLPPQLANELAERADGILRFDWSDAGTSSRRILHIVKLRGLAPILAQEQVPVFELLLERGIGFEVSRVKSVV